ncbi:hypothetical protein FIBSPDRAFT_845039 [Athelia psychrophila]|uniref:Uncharacterized protein n=1 Tax=Athelia psychrophila TaxID=1759441 RepID=A0A167TWR0_9AGAM|nr:hypothetical protein FIBSPDRAFT_845039 [Fibularhizoctonia sp. CBS 109695]
MASPSLAGPSSSNGIHKIQGSAPGVLDPTQPGRLLRHPGSRLAFASFDPTIAHPGASNAAQNTNHGVENYRPKRIVVETSPQGASFWRFVPRARREDGVPDEGVWPRVVEVAGARAEFTEDQWDIYKLDPHYQCLVRAYPRIPIITPVTPSPNDAPPTNRTNPTDTLPGKRRPPSPLAGSDADVPPPSAPKKRRGRSPGVLTSSEDEDEDMPYTYTSEKGPQRSKSQLRDLHEQNRRARRERTLRTQAKRERPLEQDQDESMFSPTHEEPGPGPRFQSMPPAPSSASKRRKGGGLARSNQPIIEEEEEEESDARQPSTRAFKRTRTASPTSIKKTLESKRATREREKQAKWSKIMAGRKKDRDAQLMHGILEEVPTPGSSQAGPSPSTISSSTTPPADPLEADEQITDAERARRAALEESIRKLQELEQDKPLWDEAAKKRQMRETAEEDELRAKAERRRQAAAAQDAHDRREKFEGEERAAAARAEAERFERAAAAARARGERSQRQRWETGPWTTARALERYRAMCAAFDSTKYAENEPLAFEDVPWPVLHAPGTFGVEDVDWAAVELFFAAVRPFVRGDEYKGFVEKSHRRFHPDRWRSRRILAGVVDEAEREELELAANVTAQALTPLWRDIK